MNPNVHYSTVIPRLTKIILSGITFVSRNLHQPKRDVPQVSLLAVSYVNNPVGLVGLPYVMWSAHSFVTHIQTEKISFWNGPTVHVCCFMLARASTKTFVSQVRKTAKKIFVSRKIRQQGHSLAEVSLQCSRSFLVQLFLTIAGVSYGRFMAMRCKLICQRIFRTVGDRQEGRDLNAETVRS